jgi:hypothetical protein
MPRRFEKSRIYRACASPSFEYWSPSFYPKSPRVMRKPAFRSRAESMRTSRVSVVTSTFPVLAARPDSHATENPRSGPFSRIFSIFTCAVETWEPSRHSALQTNSMEKRVIVAPEQAETVQRGKSPGGVSGAIANAVRYAYISCNGLFGAGTTVGANGGPPRPNRPCTTAI